MIVLKINENHGLYVVDSEDKSILSINKEDIYKLLNVIYSNDDITMDPIDETHIILNEAEKVIYESIYKYFIDFSSKKNEIKNEIDNEFSELLKQIDDAS